MSTFLRNPENACEKLIRTLRAHGRQLEIAQVQLQGLYMDSCEYKNVYLDRESIEDGLPLPCKRTDLIVALSHRINVLRASINLEQITLQELNAGADRFFNGSSSPAPQ